MQEHMELQRKKDLLEKCLEDAIRENEFAGANLMLLKDGEELLYCERGYADIEAKKPIRRDSIFRCYSMSKNITSAAVMLLVQNGKLDLQDPVSRYFPSYAHLQVESGDDVIPAENEMTVRDLLNMTSGLSYPDDTTRAGRDSTAIYEEALSRLDSDHPMTTQEFAEKFGHSVLHFEPGTDWMYGVSADILGAIVEKVSGETFGEFLKGRIFDPLGMTDTGFFVPEEKQEQLVTVYGNENDVSGAELVPYYGSHLAIRNDGRPNVFESGGAGLFSTIDDFRLFTQMLMRGGTGLNGAEILRPGIVRFMTQSSIDGPRQKGFSKWNGLEGYTYANLIRHMDHPELAVTAGTKNEYGWDGWLGTYFTNSPEDGLTLLIMLNQKGYGTGRVIRLVRNIVFG